MLKKNFFVVLVIFVIFGCAKRGYITGGEQDIYPPEVLRTSPKNFSTNFNTQEVTILFDEFVRLKDVNKQLIVSPPLKHRLEITPYNATKQIKLRFRDTLEPNTTYSLNFGQSIEDNNEGNVLQGYRYVFSTGSYIDSLSITGSIKDALERETENYISIMLYQANQAFNDSIIFTENPRYITNTLDSLTSFTLENLKEGEYLLVGIKDKNNNNRFDPKQEKIAFHSQLISIPTDEVFHLEMFKEIPDFNAVRAFETTQNKLTFAYEGIFENKKIELRKGNDLLETIITKVPEKDSLNIWYNPIEADSLEVRVYDEDFEKTFTIKPREKTPDTLSVSMKSSKRLHFRDNVYFNSTTPVAAIDNSKIELLNKDSLNVDFTTAYDPHHQRLDILFQKEEKQHYYLALYPGSVTDFFGKENDTIKTDFSTQSYSDYGNLKITLQNVKEFPIIVELTDDKGKVLAEHYSEDQNIIEFHLLNPAIYTLRIIYDSNRNGIWDTGNYLQKIQPEKVIYFPRKIDVRANWDIEETFILKE